MSAIGSGHKVRRRTRRRWRRYVHPVQRISVIKIKVTTSKGFEADAIGDSGFTDVLFRSRRRRTQGFRQLHTE